jgi:hypothetical protein
MMASRISCQLAKLKIGGQHEPLRDPPVGVRQCGRLAHSGESQELFHLALIESDWHFRFYSVQDVPEMPIAGHELEYLKWFHNSEAVNSHAFTNEGEEPYARSMHMGQHELCEE